jgi:small-conductance mechanosensitive channel
MKIILKNGLFILLVLFQFGAYSQSETNPFKQLVPQRLYDTVEVNTDSIQPEAIVPVKSDSTPKAKKEDTSIITKAGQRIDAAKKEANKEEANNEEEKPLDGIKSIISFGKIFWTIIILVFGYFTISILSKILDSLAERNAQHRYTFKSLIPFIKIVGWSLIITIIIAGVFQPPFETVLAVTASIGIAVGFAAQDILKNIFGGIMIVFDRPFQVGDKIEVGNYYGEVVEIGLRCTRIVTKDDSLVSVPNAEVVNTAVSNSNSGESNCQVVAEIWLPIDLDTSRAREIAIEAAQVSPYIYLNKPIVVLFLNDVKERRSYLKMRLKAYVSDTRNEFVFMSDMTERTTKELLAQGIVKKEDLY